jgi:hypothetical protein
MSYDFRLFMSQPGVDPLVTAQSETGDEDEEINLGPAVPAKEARKQSIAAALMNVNPAMQIFQFGFKEIARRQSITLEEAKERFRHLELNGSEDSNGIQVTLFDDTASLSVPYWHRDKKAKLVFLEIWSYLKAIQEEAGYQIYDPQLECIIDLPLDLEKATSCYANVVGRIG